MSDQWYRKNFLLFFKGLVLIIFEIEQVLITQLAVPHLEKTKGVIVNISSTLSIKPVKNYLLGLILNY